jgi:transcription-repair coupling factor (superfamily II helicase)
VDLLAERLTLCRSIIADPASLPEVLICPIQALMQAVPAPARLDEILFTLTAGEDPPNGQRGVIAWLTDSGYKRLDSIEEPGDFAVRGGIVDIFPPGSDSAVRLDFFGDRIESITEIDLDTMGSAARIPSVSLVGASTDQLLSDDRTIPFLDLLPRSCIPALVEPLELIEQGRGYYERASDARAIIGPPGVMKSLRERFHAPGGRIDFVHFSATDVATTITLPAAPLPEFARDASEAVAELGKLARDHEVCVYCQNAGEAQRLSELVA